MKPFDRHPQLYAPLCLCLLALCLAGCHTLAPMPQVDLSQPGWKIEQGQAVWRPRRGRPGIAGDLIVARRPDGRAFLQFSKSPLTLVTGQVSSTAWQIQFVPEHRRFAGAGRPSATFLWLQLPRALAGKQGRDWTFTRKSDGEWVLNNPSTGERIEGYLNP